MSRRSTLRLSVMALLVASSAYAQTAQEAQTGILDVAQIIPATCSASCDPWLAAYNACPAITGDGTTFSSCVCDATFLASSTTCLDCIGTELTAGNDVNAAQPGTVLATLNGYCGAAAAVSSVSSDSDTSTTSSTLPLTSSSSTTSTPTLAATASTTPFSESISSSSASSVRTEPTTITSTVSGNAFPVQTKEPNVFSAAGRSTGSLGAALTAVVVVVAVGGVMGGLIA